MFPCGLIIFTFLLSSCVYGPKSERKSPLNYLSGDHYETSRTGSDQYIIPVVKKKEKPTRIEGAVSVKAGMFATPLRHLNLVLLKPNGTQVHEFSTDSEGKFSFSAHLKNGSYQLKIKSEKYSGSLSFEVKSYEVSNLSLIASKN